MKGLATARIVGSFAILVTLAALNVWGDYPFYQPADSENGPEEVHLAPQPISPEGAVATVATAQPGTFSGSPYLVGPLQSPTTTRPEAETTIAINPNDPSNLVALITDYSLRPGGLTTNGAGKFAVSSDSGATWTESFVPVTGGYPTTSDGVQWLVNRDPSVAIDKFGNVFFSGLYLKLAPGQSSKAVGDSFERDHPPGGVYVCVGKLPTVSLATSNCHPIFTYTQPTGNTNDVDRDWIAVDNSNSPHSGNVYAVWTHYTGCAGTTCEAKFIAFSRSNNHGVTWSPLIQINPADQTVVDWSTVTVGSDGTIYVAYQNYISLQNRREHWMAKSTDGGKTFTPAIAITPVFKDVLFQCPARKNSAPNLVVSSVPGAEYVYDVFGNSGERGTNIGVVRSLEPKGAGGFSAITTINDTTVGRRAFPAAAVDASGTLHVMWMDTRDALNVTQYGIYATYSKDQGKTYAPNARVTPGPTNIGTDAGESCSTMLLGDYFGITVEPDTGVAHPVWTNAGLAGGQLETTTLTPQ
jgi:hypothetical protein